MKKKVLIIFFGLMLAFSAHAQVKSGDVTISINPNYPKPNEEVKATLGSLATDLDNAKISWMLNGKLSIERVGKKDFSFTVGGAGINTTIEAKVTTPDGSILNKKISIVPADVDMLWEAIDTYTPPFYKGKTMAPAENPLKIVAIPSGSSNGLSYKWTRDGDNISGASGYGKNFMTFNRSYLDTVNNIGVTVSDLRGNGIGSGSMTTVTGNPKIIFYEQDPALGIRYEQAVMNGFTLKKGGGTLVAEPYFFSPKNISSSDLELKWYINGVLTNTPDLKNILSIKPAEGQSGQARIKVSIENLKKLFLDLEHEINVNF